MASLKDMVSEEEGDMVDVKGREVVVVGFRGCCKEKVDVVAGLSRGALKRLNRGRSLEMVDEVGRRSSGAAIFS